jgi:hypothetical protein
MNDTTPVLLDIRGTVYKVTVFRKDSNVVRYRLRKRGGRTYDIDATKEPWTCDCPDATHRQRECKHVAALRAELNPVPF